MQVERITRPIEITLTAWLLIVVYSIRALAVAAVVLLPDAREAFAMLGVAQLENAWLHFPSWFHYLNTLAGLVVTIAAAVGLLRGQHWARLILVWFAWALVFSVLTTGSFLYIAPRTVMYFILVGILFSPRANEFFSARRAGA